MLAAGCGGPTVYPVSGQDFLNGKPLAAGTQGYITVRPDNGRAAIGPIDPVDGTFSLSCYGQNDGCIPGTHKVTVEVVRSVGNRDFSLIPEKYSSPGESGLTVTIDGPANDVKIELTGELKSRPTDSQTEAGDDEGIL